MSLSFSYFLYYIMDWKLVYMLIQFTVGLPTARYVQVQRLTLYLVNCASKNTVIAPMKFYDIVSELIIKWRAVLSLT